MSWDLGYLAGQAAERAIGENILAIKEGQWRQEINEVAAERNQLARKVQELEAHLREQIAYSDDLQRDLDRALQALAKAGANPTERQALSVAPHVRRQKLAEEERLRREKAEEQERQRRHQAYLASLPTPAQIEEMKQREELRERRRRRNFRILAITCLASITLAGRRQLSWPVEARHDGFSLSSLTLVFCSAQTGRAPSVQSGGGSFPRSSRRWWSDAPVDRQPPASWPVLRTRDPSPRTADLR